MQDSDSLPLFLIPTKLRPVPAGGSFISPIQPCTLRTPPTPACLSRQPIWNELLHFYSLSEMEILPSHVLVEFFCVWELDRCLTLIIPKCCWVLVPRPKSLGSQSLKSQEGKGGEPWREGHVRRMLDLQIIHASRNSVTSFCNFIIIFFYFRGPLYTRIEPWAQQ